jgi:hypothetical protein
MTARRHERELNQWPHFVLSLDQQRVHSVHVRGTGERTIPIVITHGWPGSFVELLKLVPHLQQVLGGAMATHGPSTS